METCKGNLGTKNGIELKVHESNITFHIKIWFSYFMKLSYENYIFSEWPSKIQVSQIDLN